MNIATGKEYFDLGLLTSATIRAPFLDHDGWTVEVTGQIGNASPVLHTARGQVRKFKTLDAAAVACREIGFRQFSVIVD